MSRDIGYSGGADPVASVESGWSEYLDSDEKILWHGRPVAGYRPTIRSLAQSVSLTVFVALTLFVTLSALNAGDRFWMIPFLLFAIGLGAMFGPHFWKWHTLKRSWYALTNKRGIIAMDRLVLGRQFQSYPIDGTTYLDYRPGAPASVYFAKEERRGNKGRRYSVDVGFDRIADGDFVYKLIRQIQGQAT